MRKEIDKAVETFHRIAFGTGKNGRKTINDNQLVAFVSVLTNLLILRYRDNWYPENPNRGSGYRCLRINSQCMDPTIVDSLIESEISLSKELRNLELTIWVDPGVVSIRIGEDGSIGTEEVEMDKSVSRNPPVPRDPPVVRKDSTSEDEAYSSRSTSPADSDSSSNSARSPVPQSLSPVHSSPASSAYNSPKIPHPHQHGALFYNQNASPSSILSSSPPSASRRSTAYHHRQHLPHPHTRIPSPSHDLNSPIDAWSSSGSRIPSPHQYSRPRSLFPSQDSNSNGNYPGYFKEGMMAAHQAHHAAVSMHMTRSVLPQGNYMDIPAQA